MILENNLLARVREILKRDDTILFIGSGLSLWSGLPSWSNLLEEMAKYIERLGYSAELVRKEVDSGNLLQAASYGVDLLPPREFPRFIRQVCHYGEVSPHLIHEKVVTLGPTCFITTNYDQLIEDAFRQIHGSVLRSVTNNQLAETADIIQARANNFIFKPHGDVTDSNSVILTREQYRSILHGERKAALEALKVLLVSRPIVFLGFGLRDPDFIFVQDYLLDVFKGEACDYYAVMASVSDQERSFWLRKYGLHILTYQTVGEDKRDHSLLLTLLDSLLNTNEKNAYAPPLYKGDKPLELLPEQILALARYAKKIVYTLTVTNKLELPLHASYVRKDTNQLDSRESRYFSRQPKIENLLSEFTQNMILIGNPGAGKTYSLKRYCSVLAKNLEDACLNDVALLSTFRIPLYVDMKLYNGNLWKIAEESLPSLLPLNELCSQGQVIFVLDSYNELPREYAENGHIERDLATFLQRIGGCRVIIASRTIEGLQSLALPMYCLDEIDYYFVSKYLQEHNKPIQGVFQEELLYLLRKPLYFRLYIENKIALQGNVHPRQVYESLFATLNSDFEQKFGTVVDLGRILSPIAYDSISTGQEAVDLVELQGRLVSQLSKAHITTYDVKELINWLISREVLVPAAGSRLSFFHQSVTEYLAAGELARLYAITPDVLDRCVRYTRWDQALYLTLGFLNKDQGRSFMKRLIQTDLLLAIRAAKYAEYERDQVVAKILNAILTGKSRNERKLRNDVWSRSWNLGSLPVSATHEARLRKLLKCRDVLGGTAGGLLLDIHGAAIKNELIDEMFQNANDYNFCTALGRALRHYIDSNDLGQVVNRFRNLTLHHVPGHDEEEEHGLLSGCATMFSEFNPDELLKAFQPWQKLNPAQLGLLHTILWENHTSQVNSLKVELIKHGDMEAIFPLNLALYSNEQRQVVDPNFFDKETVAILIESLTSYEQGNWATDILQYICEVRADLSEIVKESAAKAEGLLRLILLYCYSVVDKNGFWDELNRLSFEGVEERDRRFLPFFSEFEINWTDRTDLLIRILKQRDGGLAHAVLSTFEVWPDDRQWRDNQYWQIALEPLEWWLDFLNDGQASDVFIDGSDFRSALGLFIALHAASETHQQLIARFNQAGYLYRKIIADYILNAVPGMTTDLLSDDAINFLINELKQPCFDNKVPLLAYIATEEFVEKYLLPLLDYNEEPLKTNLYSVLSEAGDRHRRRYIIEP
jgi:hypothetical protein